MRVKELIEKLEQLDPDLHVMVSGYEGGYHDVEVSPVRRFKFYQNSAWWYGPHEIVESGGVEGIIIQPGKD